MSVSSSPSSASRASSDGSVDEGPQSKSAGPSFVSTRYTPTACGRPPKSRSRSRNELITASLQSRS